MANAAFSLARRLRAGETVYSAWCSLPEPLVCEAIAREGFGAVVIDMQHGMWDEPSALQAVSYVHLAGAAPIVRVPLWHNSLVSRMLDWGAEGIIAPMINGEAEARAFVQAAKYPPVGERSVGAHRAAMVAGVSDQKLYIAEANTTTLTFAMIETQAALDSLDRIAAMPGIDVLFVGPGDLSLSLSNGATLDPHSAAVEGGLEKVLAACARHGKIPGLFCRDAERATEKARSGFRFLTVGSDLTFLRAGTAAQLKAL
ncbi:HpcH/HpaI aldolase family protein [Pseudorhodoplanes sp.]|jgi:4-hydroxy-2-oxoheptanedioate aldolase|uniref:HpcH/HpaI aldolase family protein n=1 Tax=Pseudorhodoplanes sp. TaxID=1934341 RepID=UPI002BA276C2|nr:aldolase/citrate lyase family protein [Pseudorhodoplanes sp.]HWV44208.1 aldolase/citrate lyase family protein [Pseudorhodoplanes sp.]